MVGVKQSPQQVSAAGAPTLSEDLPFVLQLLWLVSVPVCQSQQNFSAVLLSQDNYTTNVEILNFLGLIYLTLLR